jgi:glycosyltransferase involved in cell wall biosynthesis
MIPSRPLVSIVIPVYNGARYLGEAIDSALAQTYSPCEIVVINDGSNDNGATEAVALKYGEKIRYFSKPNGGVASALNRGIEEMKGEYFSWLSHDDLYCPDKIEVEMKLLFGKPAGSIAFSDYRFIDEHGRPLETVRFTKVSRNSLQELLIAEASIHGCTLLIPAACFREAGRFDEKRLTTQDFYLWYAFSKVFAFFNAPEVTVLSRVHAQQGSRTMSSIAKKEHNEYRFWAIRQFSQDNKGGDLAFRLARIATRLKIVGCEEESRFAADCSRQARRGQSLLLRPVASLVLVYRLLWPRKLMFGYVKSYVRSLIMRMCNPRLR